MDHPLNLTAPTKASAELVQDISDGKRMAGRIPFYLEDPMDKDRVEGKLKDIAGRAERQAGEWTGSEKTQAEGAAKQVEGKVQNAWGKVKDAVKPSGSERDEEAEDRDRAVNE